uniref:WLM domain-containing protein n=1 Tax=Craspedostauros australis TaxID=1486917 RepID=A0A7R9WVU5_9STRA|mmetsp:Transcript_22056/g.61380  ORF Transcript_22056/g.61380 Transcript_22056/m.61380 type:complete len:410 (+) Transcript_22056:206-1435(+)
MTTKICFSFRGKKNDVELTDDLTVAAIKDLLVEQLAAAAASTEAGAALTTADIRLVLKGKVLSNANDRLRELICAAECSQAPKKRKYTLLATATSSSTKQRLQQQMEVASKSRTVRDDLTTAGQAKEHRRKMQGRRALRNTARTPSSPYGFGSIDVLPNLPHQDTARGILTQLANDPGVLACMAQHKWKVGSLAELYPDGKVGQSAVCVMGLNKNQGQQILLRLRTDDLKGFRKMLSIRKVLFHELAHNVHSEHDSKFFQLMRQIEKECNEMDWTQGSGLSAFDGGNIADDSLSFEGGTYRLGSSSDVDSGHRATSHSSFRSQSSSHRELAARAALSRMSVQEMTEIEDGCGCGLEREDLFLPSPVPAGALVREARHYSMTSTSSSGDRAHDGGANGDNNDHDADAMDE